MADANPDAVHSAPWHLPGVTRVCFSPDGKSIFSAGSDCLVRIYKAEDPDAEPGFHDNHPEPVTSITASKRHLITGCMDSISRVFADNDLDGYITRSKNMPIRWVQVDKAGERVAVCSDDYIVKIVHVNERERVHLLSDNDGPVRSASWDPSGQYLVTAGCDGKLKVYDTSGASPFNKRNLEGMIRTSDKNAEASCYVAWHPSGNYFAVPLRTNDVGVVAKDTWSKLAGFSADGHRQPVSELAWSPNGKYLASAADSQILIWATDGRHVVARYQYPGGNVSGLAWSPTSNMIAFTAMDGSFNRWTEPVPSDLTSPYLSDEAVARKADRLLDDDLFGDAADAELDDQGEELVDDAVDDWLVDDEGVLQEEDTEDRWVKGRTEVVNVTKAQAPFVPGGTAWKSKKRYLAFNMIGVVDSTDQETHNVVNVEFHDKSARRGYHFSDHSKYTMASLGEQGIVYAAPADPDTKSASVVNYRPYDSWASSSDWTVDLLPGENALSVAVGGADWGLGTVVVATSKGLVRFFTASGVQRYVWRLGEEVVTLAAGRDALLVVHREGGTSLDGCQNLRYTLLDLDTFNTVQEGRVPLPRGTTLTWAGFSYTGVPFIYDSTGVLSALDRFRQPRQARWVPLFDGDVARGAKRETYWPVGVGENVLHAIILKGSEREPFFPRPLIQDLELGMPLLGMENGQGAGEERVARREVLLSADGEDTKATRVAIDKELLQLVQGACKADALARALDLVRMMHSTSTLDAAKKLADFYHLPGLAERIARVKAEKGVARGTWVDEVPLELYSSKPRAPAPASRDFGDFAPAAKRRSFAGRADRDNRDSVVRAETPIASRQTFIPETPGAEDDYEDFGATTDEPESLEPFDTSTGRTFDESLPQSSPKRKRGDIDGSDEFVRPAAPKNPFAKRAAMGGSNPFAKASVARPLDSVKSTSFFERVDDIESKPLKKKPATAAAQAARGKQATLFGMGATKRPNPKPRDSYMSSATETDDPEPEREALEETVVQETVGPEDSVETLVD